MEALCDLLFEFSNEERHRRRVQKVLDIEKRQE